MATYGYARVSTQEQNVARQLDAFKQFGVEESNIFVDKQSGKNFDRANYQKLASLLQKKDLLVIKSIDRLGRNYSAIICEWNRITNIIGADIKVLDMPLLDTRANGDSLVGKFISDIVLQLLSFVAENERVNIRQRQKEGIASAKLRGVKFGRPQTRYTQQFVDVFEQYFDKKISIAEVGRLLGLNRCNCYYHANRICKLGIASPQKDATPCRRGCST